MRSSGSPNPQSMLSPVRSPRPEGPQVVPPQPDAPARSVPRESSRLLAEESPAEAERLDAVRAMMLELAAGARFERLGAIVQEHLYTGGKRLRAKLALGSLEALGGDPTQGVAWAAACELLHNATLVHDDLQDHDPVRRGHFAVWVRHGQAQAINAGDLLLMLPFIALEHLSVEPALRWHLSRAIARRAEQTVRGQSLEMCLLHGGRWDWDSYADAATGKTSALMALPVHGAALLAGRGPMESERLADCFMRVGLLFQIQDDIIDLFGDKGRGEIGGDLREGRVSALVVEHLRLHPEDQSWLIELLSRPRDATSDRDVEEVAERFRHGGALAGALARIEDERAALESAPELAAEPQLRQVALELVELSVAPLAKLSSGWR
jgi:geranylgeranyl diphosphate synthase type I